MGVIMGDEYIEKLKDPRWQKKRLEIFKRDGWACQVCYDDKATLHVHHRYYEAGKAPWEYPPEAFSTLCEECHLDEKNQRKRVNDLLIKAFRQRGFLSGDLIEIAEAFAYMKFDLPTEVVTSVIKWVLSDTVFEDMCIGYFNSIRKAGRK